MVMKVRDILDRLRRDGWLLRAVEGSHHQYLHPKNPGKVTVSYDQIGDDIGGPTLKSIFRQAGWK
jgi:predicted RNA binding protein YcfA (HicA-like mRNA interferase family)